MKRVELFGLEGIAEVHAGDSVGQLICEACERQRFELADGDLLVVAQKIVSKAEGQVLELAAVHPSARAHELAHELGKECVLHVDGQGKHPVEKPLDRGKLLKDHPILVDQHV